MNYYSLSIGFFIFRKRRSGSADQTQISMLKVWTSLIISFKKFRLFLYLTTLICYSMAKLQLLEANVFGKEL